MATERSDLELEVRRLREAVESIERRLARLEMSSPTPLPGTSAASSSPTPASGSGERLSSQLHLARLSVACFALVGALLLRVATQQGWFSPPLGYGLGLAYTAALMGVPLALWRSGRPLGYGSMLQLCGGLLAPLIIIEATRNQVVEVGVAVIVLAAVSLAGLALGWVQRSGPLLASILCGQVAGVAALGGPALGAGRRGALLVGIAALAELAAARRSWPFLRPLILVPVGLLLGAAVLVTASNPEVPRPTAQALMLSLLALGLVVAVNYAARFAVLDGFERASVPVATLAVYGLALLYSPGFALPGGATVAALLLAVIWARGLARPEERGSSAGQGPAARQGLLATSALLGASSLPWLDPTGLGLASQALLVQRLDRRGGGWAGALLCGLLAVTALATALLAGRLWSLACPWHVPACGLGLAGLLLFQFWLWQRCEHRPARWLAPVSLALALAASFAAMRLAIGKLVPRGEGLAVAQSGLLALVSLAPLLAARRGSVPGGVQLGVLGIVILAGKVLLWDIRQLTGPALVTSVLILGLAALLASLVLRRRSRPRPAGEQAPK